MKAAAFQTGFEKLFHNEQPILMGTKTNFILKTDVLKYVLEGGKKTLEFKLSSY